MKIVSNCLDWRERKREIKDERSAYGNTFDQRKRKSEPNPQKALAKTAKNICNLSVRVALLPTNEIETRSMDVMIPSVMKISAKTGWSEGGTKAEKGTNSVVDILIPI
ncbi:hypothetical protein M0813_28025 [Anaeramoeba flamelloides]|uniref:Uncharacterized protein n=1 Tax=Anaeramoeba flamelloides TaxID=1746091 RepID=A0ABQ8XVU8_9EUKA|nr:hypothetical protein M0813_28025 [Anaeramoeba flamelloides]